MADQNFTKHMVISLRVAYKQRRWPQASSLIGKETQEVI
jgi:hypothetical protein